MDAVLIHPLQLYRKQRTSGTTVAITREARKIEETRRKLINYSEVGILFYRSQVKLPPFANRLCKSAIGFSVSATLDPPAVALGNAILV